MIKISIEIPPHPMPTSLKSSHINVNSISLQLHCISFFLLLFLLCLLSLSAALLQKYIRSKLSSTTIGILDFLQTNLSSDIVLFGLPFPSSETCLGRFHVLEFLQVSSKQNLLQSGNKEVNTQRQYRNKQINKRWFFLNPFTPKSDQFQISPANSPEILHHTVWRTWLFIAYSDEM